MSQPVIELWRQMTAKCILLFIRSARLSRHLPTSQQTGAPTELQVTYFSRSHRKYADMLQKKKPEDKQVTWKLFSFLYLLHTNSFSWLIFSLFVFLLILNMTYMCGLVLLTTPKDHLVPKLRIGKSKHRPRCCRGKNWDDNTTRNNPNNKQRSRWAEWTKRRTAHKEVKQKPAQPGPASGSCPPQLICHQSVHISYTRNPGVFFTNPKSKLVGQVFINSFKVQCCHFLSWSVDFAPSLSMKHVFIWRSVPTKKYIHKASVAPPHVAALH